MDARRRRQEFPDADAPPQQQTRTDIAEIERGQIQTRSLDIQTNQNVPSPTRAMAAT